jgi:hypothetical protein
MSDARIAQVRVANEQIFSTMHNALLDCLETEMSVNGQIAAKKIATDALVRVAKIARSLA